MFAPAIPKYVQELFETCTKSATEIFYEGRQVVPVILFRKKGKGGIIGVTEMSCAQQKDGVAEMIWNLRKDCEAVAFVSEVWTRQETGTEYQARDTIEGLPGTTEALSIAFYMPERIIITGAKIHRNPNRLEPWSVWCDSLNDNVDGLKGRMVNPHATDS